MTTTYDPAHPQYLDEADLRTELTRVFELCHGCRRCVELCGSFPILFDLIDRIDGHDAGLLTPAEQDRVVDECYQCGRCAVGCPYTPERHERALDFPRLVLRAQAMRHTTGQQPLRRRAATQTIVGVAGRVATAAPSLANRLIGAPEGSFVRTMVATLTGVSAARLLPPYAKQRFSTWFRKRTPDAPARRRGTVTVFPTCLVEYHETGIGKDLVRVYERNGITCAVSTVGCCGAPWLHSGDVAHFSKLAERNVRTLAGEIRRGGDLVVPQPTCGDVLTRDYVDHVGAASKADAALVAEHTHDATEYLMQLHGADGLDIGFSGPVPARVAYHVACHRRARTVGLRSRELIELTGAAVTVVAQCAGVGGMWGMRAENDARSIPIATRLGAAIVQAGGGAPGVVVAGDCHLANTAIVEQTGTSPVHPIQLLARAYGIPAE